MSWPRRKWVVGCVAIVSTVGLYLLLTSPGRALYFAAVGIAPCTPRTEVEGRIGEPDGFSPDGYPYAICIGPGTKMEWIEQTLESLRRDRMRYSGPLYAVDIQYAGHRNPRFESTHIKGELTPKGMLTLFGLLTLAVAAFAALRLLRTRTAALGGLS